LEQQFGTETMQRMMTDDGEIAYYLRHGHTDIKKMAAAHEMIQSPEAPEITGAKQAEALLQLHNMTGNVNGLKQKDKKEWIATISEQARKNGIANPDAFAEARMRELEEFSKKNK
jgi:hypothetical protein